MACGQQFLLQQVKSQLEALKTTLSTRKNTIGTDLVRLTGADSECMRAWTSIYDEIESYGKKGINRYRVEELWKILNKLHQRPKRPTTEDVRIALQESYTNRLQEALREVYGRWRGYFLAAESLTTAEKLSEPHKKLLETLKVAPNPLIKYTAAAHLSDDLRIDVKILEEQLDYLKLLLADGLSKCDHKRMHTSNTGCTKDCPPCTIWPKYSCTAEKRQEALKRVAASLAKLSEKHVLNSAGQALHQSFVSYNESLEACRDYWL